jgi:predicted dehydrogenase
LLHEDKVIGKVHRMFADFGLDMDIASLGPESRLKNPALGAGTLLDIGIYSLTWALISLDSGLGQTAEIPKVVASQTLSDNIDLATSVVLQYPSGKQGIITSTTQAKTPDVFCRIEGSEGYITVESPGASLPASFTVYSKMNVSSRGEVTGSLGDRPNVKQYQFENPGRGFFWEADAVALDVAAGRKESDVMPWAETVRVMEIMDEVRRQGGARFPRDDQ